MKTLYETARDSLIVIESIASGSTTTNSLHHLARLAREGLTAIESADRAQQDEPVAMHHDPALVEAYNKGYEACLATKAAAPADAPKWHAPGMGEVHSHDHKYMIDCQREIDHPDQDYVADDKLAKRVCAALNRTASVPDTGIP